MKKMIATLLSLVIATSLMTTIVLASEYDYEPAQCNAVADIVLEAEHPEAEPDNPEADAIDMEEAEYIPEYNPEYETETDIDEPDEDTCAETPDYGYEIETTYISIMPLSAVPVSTWADLALEISGGATEIEITTNIMAGNAIPITGTVTISSTGGYTLTQSNTNQRHFTVFGGTLTLENITLAGAGSGNRGGVSVNGGGTFNMYGGAISGNHAPQGGGVIVSGGSTFNMNGGTISGNEAVGGGGIFIDDSSFTMHNGTISGNAANSGGAIFVMDGSFTMHNGSIINNTGRNNINNTSGVLLHENSTFIMHDGTISGHTSAATGAGVAVFEGSSFTMHNGTISNNDAHDSGGGVHVRDFIGGNSHFIMHNGTINGNTASVNGGGGVMVGIGGNFVMNNGNISGNSFTSLGSGNSWDSGGGGGIAVWSNGTFTMHNGTIGNNTSSYFGGGIWASNTVTIHNGTISGNTANNGGGVFVWDSNFTMHDGAISNNTAVTNGGGIFTTTYNTLTIDADVAFTGNSAAQAFFPPANVSTSFPSIQYYSTTIPLLDGTFIHPVNNFDIVRASGTQITFYSVTYNANGGTGNPHIVTNIAVGAQYPILAPGATGISRPGYTFTGWNTAADGSGATHAAGSIVTIDSNIILFAQWTPIINEDDQNNDDETGGGGGSGGSSGCGNRSNFGGGTNRPVRPTIFDGEIIENEFIEDEYILNEPMFMPYEVIDREATVIEEPQENEAHVPLNATIIDGTHTNNPQTNDSFNLTGLMLSALGLIMSVLAILYALKAGKDEIEVDVIHTQVDDSCRIVGFNALTSWISHVAKILLLPWFNLQLIIWFAKTKLIKSIKNNNKGLTFAIDLATIQNAY